MGIGRTQIVVGARLRLAVVIVGVIVVMAMAVGVTLVGMIMILPQQKGAGDIDAKTDDRDEDRLVEVDCHGIFQPNKTLPGHQKGDQREDDGARKTGEISKLSSAEGKTRIAGLAAGIEVGERSNQECAGMCGHVPPSATSAIDPNIVPPTISATIMTVVSAMTNQTRRSLR